MWPTSNSNSNQWSFNPAVYQNVPYEQVDWATLAQQWIKMKETLPSVSLSPPPPPAPQISKPKETPPSKSTPAAPETRSTNDIEGGEAPMDMDTKDDDVPPALGVASDSNWKQWNDWQSQWGWGWPRNSGTVTLGEKTTSSASTVSSKVKSLSNDSNPVLNNYVSNVGTFPNNSGTTSTPQVPGSFNYNKVAGGAIPPTHPKSGYWTENTFKSTGSKVGNKNSNQKSMTESYPVMDAAKKKQLPAWIRDGLNKMEREKQKKMEYERMVQEKLMRDQISPEKSFKNDIFVENNETLVNSPPVEKIQSSPPERHEKNQSLSAEVGTSRYQRSTVSVENTDLIRKTKDQIMEESMLKVRRILTEFLLEATENEVATIAKEELRKRKSASAPQIRKSNALTSLTGNLGLAVYDSDSESSNSEREINDHNVDSDEELEMLIEKKKRDFTLIEDQIEEEIENQEYNERLVVQRNQEHGNNEDTRDSKSHNKDANNHDVPENSKHPDSEERSDKNGEKSDSVFKNKTSRDRPEKSLKIAKGKKAKKRSRSPSTSSSSSSESSSSTESSSSGSDRSRSKADSSSSSSRHSNSKKKGRKKSRKKDENVEKKSKRSKQRSKSRSTSRSRYSRNENRYKDSGDRKEKSNEQKRAGDYRKTSDRDSYQRRSASYRRDSRESRDSSSSKYYKNSRKHESSDSKRKRRRSSSADSRYSHYKRHR